MPESNILLETGTNELEIVEFNLEFSSDDGQQHKQPFGINVAKVREIIRMPQLTKLPNMHNCIYGIFTLRNRIIPALDLSKYLYYSENINMQQKMIIAEFNKMECGFIVNDVQRIHRISWTQIDPPDTITQFDTKSACLIGIIRFENRNVLMLDVEKIIADIDPRSAIDDDIPDLNINWKPKIITVEDSITIRHMIKDKMEKAGFEVIAFSNGQEAWDYFLELSSTSKDFNAVKKSVNLIITDVEMPQMDGYTLTKNIKTNEKLKNLPVIIFSSIVSSDILHKGQSVGADAQLSKPQIGELITIANTLLVKP